MRVFRGWLVKVGIYLVGIWVVSSCRIRLDILGGFHNWHARRLLALDWIHNRLARHLLGRIPTSRIVLGLLLCHHLLVVLIVRHLLIRSWVRRLLLRAIVM